jgi:hypothetical protein
MSCAARSDRPLYARNQHRERILGAQSLLEGCQRAFMEQPRSNKISSVMEEEAKVIEAHPRIGMLGTEYLFSKGQCSSEE